MTSGEAVNKLSQLKVLRKVYDSMIKSKNEDLFSLNDLFRLRKMANQEIINIVDLMNSMELEDSYDQNTGEVNKIYRLKTEEEQLLRFCGGKKK